MEGNTATAQGTKAGGKPPEDLFCMKSYQPHVKELEKMLGEEDGIDRELTALLYLEFAVNMPVFCKYTKISDALRFAEDYLKREEIGPQELYEAKMIASSAREVFDVSLPKDS